MRIGEKMESVNQKESQRLTQRVARRVARFGRAEDGTIIVMTLTWLMLMLIVGGMAVDFMRFEAKRAVLQSTADRAVLAAASLSQNKTPESVVIDYFTKAGLADSIIYPINVVDTGNFTSVGVNAKLPMKTYFLKLLGIEDLKAPAASTAVEGVADIEVSLILDISGSMDQPVTPSAGSSTTEKKIVALRRAAGKFVDAILLPEYAGNISISLVPYSEQVNAGPDLFDELNTNKMHDFSYCIEFGDTDFKTLAINPKQTSTRIYNQMQHYQWNGGGNDLSETVCPRWSYERIIPLTQNVTTLKTAINALQPRAGTAIYTGLKWGLGLLDAEMAPAISSLITKGKIDASFAGRPAAYNVPGQVLTTQKVIVLMTDGANSRSERLMPFAYSTPNHVAFWANNNLWYFVNRELGGRSPFGLYTTQRYADDPTNTNQTYGPLGGTNGDLLMQDMCTLAKNKDVIIYTIAVEAGTHGANEMAACASSPSHFFNVNGDQMDTVFEGIAKQITELRLSL